jgi:hypothetical protein
MGNPTKERAEEGYQFMLQRAGAARGQWWATRRKKKKKPHGSILGG